MTTRKPDWAQRMVQRHVGVEDSEPENYRAVMLPAKQVESLLRTHHRKVKRMVQKLNQDSAHLYCNCDEINAYRLACEHIMDKLKELEQ